MNNDIYEIIRKLSPDDYIILVLNNPQTIEAVSIFESLTNFFNINPKINSISSQYFSILQNKIYVLMVLNTREMEIYQYTNDKEIEIDYDELVHVNVKQLLRLIKLSKLNNI